MILQRVSVRSPLPASALLSTPGVIIRGGAIVLSPLSSSSSSSVPASFHSSARRRDHYQTLEVPKGASQKDIKAQFYKLSKKWHPDVNPDSENANQKFQQVSEAYATLGHEASRKDYDRELNSYSSSRFGSPRGAGRGQYRYASDNVQRRASASYAWEYQRRRSPPGGTKTGNASQSRSQYREFGRGGAPRSGGQSSLFEQFVERERRKEAATAARMADATGSGGSTTGRQNSSSYSKEEHEAQTASPLIRFCQVTGLFFIVFYLGTKLAHSNEPRKSSR